MIAGNPEIWRTQKICKAAIPPDSGSVQSSQTLLFIALQASQGRVAELEALLLDLRVGLREVETVAARIAALSSGSEGSEGSAAEGSAAGGSAMDESGPELVAAEGPETQESLLGGSAPEGSARGGSAVVESTPEESAGGSLEGSLQERTLVPTPVLESMTKST